MLTDIDRIPSRSRRHLSSVGLFTLSLALLGVSIPMSTDAAEPPPAKQTSDQTKAEPDKAKEEVEDRTHWKAGVVELKSDLERGFVEIGGKRVSDYPLPGPWTLSPGRYVLTLRDGTWSQTRRVEVTPGKTSIVKIYRDPANDPDSKEVPDDFQIVPDEPDVELYHPGAGFNVTTMGYILLGVSALSLGYGVYEQIASSDAERTAQSRPDSQADQRSAELESAMAGSWRSRVALGFGGVVLLSGVAFSMFGSGGWLDSMKMKPKTGPVFGPGASLKRRPSWGVAVTGEGSSLWASWRW